MIDEVMGSYRLIQKIGEGGMGTVYLAEHVLLGREAAVKLVAGPVAADRRSLQRFFDEARAAALANHPGLVQVFDFGVRTDGLVYIVMEYLDGESLGDRLRRVGA